jgi:hypothetical protein
MGFSIDHLTVVRTMFYSTLTAINLAAMALQSTVQVHVQSALANNSETTPQQSCLNGVHAMHTYSLRLYTCVA